MFVFQRLMKCFVIFTYVSSNNAEVVPCCKNTKKTPITIANYQFFCIFAIRNLKTNGYEQAQEWKTTDQAASGRDAADPVSAESERDFFVETNIQGIKVVDASGKDAGCRRNGRNGVG